MDGGGDAEGGEREMGMEIVYRYKCDSCEDIEESNIKWSEGVHHCECGGYLWLVKRNKFTKGSMDLCEECGNKNLGKDFCWDCKWKK